MAIYQDGSEAPSSPGAFDVLAAFYRVRTMPLQPGQRFFLESHDNRKNYPLRVTVQRRERVETPGGIVRLPGGGADAAQRRLLQERREDSPSG